MTKAACLYWFLAIILITGCKEKYEAILRPEQKNFLVVEGILNPAGNTSVRLSRSIELNDSAGVVSESGAIVTVAGNDGSVTSLEESSPGNYSGYLTLLTDNTYSLNIITREGKNYASAIQTIKATPPIDSISWVRNNKGVQIEVNNASGISDYYKWEYEETWEIHSAYEAQYQYIEPQVLPRPLDVIRLMFTCWSTAASTRILIGNSTQLTQDFISQAPILLIPHRDERLSVRYSILVKQFAIDENTYNFYQQLKTNTESLGSLFDPLPTDISGNILCTTDPSEKVIGHISIASPQEKRIFISKTEVPGWAYKPNCEVIEVPANLDDYKRNYPPLIPFEAIGSGPAITAYKSTSLECLDCRTRGTNNRPIFW